MAYTSNLKRKCCIIFLILFIIIVISLFILKIDNVSYINGLVIQGTKEAKGNLIIFLIYGVAILLFLIVLLKLTSHTNC